MERIRIALTGVQTLASRSGPVDVRFRTAVNGFRVEKTRAIGTIIKATFLMSQGKNMSQREKNNGDGENASTRAPAKAAAESGYRPR